MPTAAEVIYQQKMAAIAQQEAAKKAAAAKVAPTVPGAPAPAVQPPAVPNVAAAPQNTGGFPVAVSPVTHVPANVPADSRQWSPHDFRAVNAAGDPRLEPALEQRLKRPHRTAEEAAMLVSLLAPTGRPPLPPPPGKQPLAVLIVAVLRANATPEAQTTIREIVEGKVPLEDEGGAVDGALTVLLKSDADDGVELVVRAIVTPHEVREPRPGRMTPEVLRQRAIAVARANATPALRRELAKALLDDRTPPDARRQLHAALLEKNPANLEAQVLVYGAGTIDGATNAALERHFTEISRAAMTTVLGFPPVKAGETLPDDEVARVSKLLWTRTLAEMADLRLRAAATPGERAPTLALAATVPTDVMRTFLYRALNRQWNQALPSLVEPGSAATGAYGGAPAGGAMYGGAPAGGAMYGGAPAGGTVTGGAAGSVGGVGPPVFDPGLIVVLKSLVNENRRSKPTQPVRLTRPFGMSTPHGKPKEIIMGGLSAATQMDWEVAIDRLVLSLGRHCHLAALARAAAALRTGEPVPAPNVQTLPFAMYPDAAPAAFYYAEWPGKWGAPSDPKENWRVTYLRYEERGKALRPLGFYRRQLKGYEERRAPNGYWLATMLNGREEGRKCSLDVAIYRADGALLEDGDQPLTIELLSIEIRDPAL